MDQQPTVPVPMRQEPPAEPPAGANGPKRLYRPREGRFFLGVCAGLAEYFDTDPVLMRALFAVITLLAGAGLLVYLVLALIMPSEDALHLHPRAAAQQTVDEAADELRRGINRGVDAVRGAFGKPRQGA